MDLPDMRIWIGLISTGRGIAATVERPGRGLRSKGLEMRLRIIQSALVILAVGILVGGHPWALSGGNTVEVDGDRLSVHAEGIALDELLAVVEELTGVEFTFTGSVATKKIFLDFIGLPLAKGIKKIVHPLSCAAVYDDTGKLRRVVILGEWKGSATQAPREGGDEPPGSGRRMAPSTEPRGSDTPIAPRGLPMRKRPARLGTSSPNTGSSRDEKLDGQEQTMEGSSSERTYAGDGPPKSESELPEGPPNAEVPDHPPPPDSGDAPMEGPPMDRAYSMDGPPTEKTPEMEGPPGRGER